MSQYPFPPPPYSPPMVDPRAWGMAPAHGPGRAAAIWQLVLGGLIFLSGTCVMSAVWVVPDDVMIKAVQQQGTNLPVMQNMTPVQEVRLFMTVGSGLMMVAGGLLILLAIFVRKGGKASSVISIVILGLISLVLLMNFVTGLLQVATRPAAALPVVVIAGMLALCGVTIVKLVVVTRASGPDQSLAMQQAYYWMMQQQGSGYGGYGYGQQYQQPPVGGVPQAPPGNFPPQPPGPPLPPGAG